MRGLTLIRDWRALTKYRASTIQKRGNCRSLIIREGRWRFLCMRCLECLECLACSRFILQIDTCAGNFESLEFCRVELEQKTPRLAAPTAPARCLGFGLNGRIYAAWLRSLEIKSHLGAICGMRSPSAGVAVAIGECLQASSRWTRSLGPEIPLMVIADFLNASKSPESS